MPPRAARIRKPNRRPGSCPVTQLRPRPGPDDRIPVVASYLTDAGLTAVQAFNLSFDADLLAAMIAREAAPS